MKATDLEEKNRFLNQRYREIRKFWDVSDYWRDLILEIKKEIKENDDKLKALRNNRYKIIYKTIEIALILINHEEMCLTTEEIERITEYFNKYSYYVELDIKQFDNTHFKVKLK